MERVGRVAIPAACALRRLGFLLWLVAGPASADVVIDNGLAPPDPANVIDTSIWLPAELVLVRNAGCGIATGSCPLPWGGPTTVAIVGGGEVNWLSVRESSRVVVDGGYVATLYGSDSSSLAIEDGLVGAVSTDDFASVTIAGGTIGDLALPGASSVLAGGSSLVSLSGGTVDRMWAQGGATILVDGGTISSGLTMFGSSSAAVSGGSLGIVALDTSRVEVTGGVVDGVGAFGSSEIAVVGRQFAIDGSPVGFGAIEALSGTLTGVLASGDPIESEFCHAGCTLDPEEPATGVITLVPEADAGLRLPALAVALLHVIGRPRKRID